MLPVTEGKEKDGEKTSIRVKPKGMFVFCISKGGTEMWLICSNLPKLEVHFLPFFSNF